MWTRWLSLEYGITPHICGPSIMIFIVLTMITIWRTVMRNGLQLLDILVVVLDMCWPCFRGQSATDYILYMCI